MEGLLQRYSSSLQSKGRYLEAVELYRMANKPHEAALLTGVLGGRGRGLIVDALMNAAVHLYLPACLHVYECLRVCECVTD